MCSLCGFMENIAEDFWESNSRREPTNFRKEYDIFGEPWNSSLNAHPIPGRDLFNGIASNQLQAELRRLFNYETEEKDASKLIPPNYNLFEERFNRNLYTKYLLQFYRMNLNEFFECEINLSACHSCCLTFDNVIPLKRIICESFWWSMIFDSNNYHLQCECAQHRIWQSEESQPVLFVNEFQCEEIEEQEELYLPIQQSVRPRPLLGAHHHNQGMYPANLKSRRDKPPFSFGLRGFRGQKHRSPRMRANAKKSNVNSH